MINGSQHFKHAIDNYLFIFLITFLLKVLLLKASFDSCYAETKDVCWVQHGCLSHLLRVQGEADCARQCGMKI